MEDRKRSLIADQDDTPPSKRQATTVNGSLMRMEPEKEKEIEHYQKGAIFRQMKEFKRERNDLEAQLNDLTKRATWHDDHIRTIDAWFSQLLDEIRILINDQATTSSAQEADRLPSSLLTQENPLFEEHLKSRSGKIRTAITEIFSKFPPSTPEVTEVQERMGNLLAQEKAHVVELQRLTDERDSLAERLENASYRYLVAEKKLDRAKSKAVQEMEQQAIMKREDDTGAKDKGVKKEGSTETNGEVNQEASAATDLARREAVAAAEKRKVQIDQLESENKRLSEELSAAKVKTASFSDDDYANSGLFSLVKTQLEGMIKRLNDLEAANVALREEAQKLQAERNSYRTQLDEETRTAADENESQLARNEGDLARIRNARDELQAELSILQGGGEGSQKQSLEMTKELASARDSRISALESELERVRLQHGENAGPNADSSLDELGADDLRSKLRTLQTQYAMVSNELPSMEAAWKKTQALAAKKVAEISNWEEQIARVNSEKARADQKYFAAMKAKDARDSELRALKAQNAKTSEIVSQLKDTESSTRALVSNLEKQVAEAKDSLTGLSQQNRALQQKVNEGNVASENLKTEIAKLKELVTSRDATTAEASKAKRAAEVELEECKVKLEDSKKQVSILKKRGSGRDTTDNAEDWRSLAICSICKINLRNTALKLCGHVFCEVCVKDLISNRNRKCPSCGKAFGSNDSMSIVLA